MNLKKKRKRFKSKSWGVKKLLAERLNGLCKFLDNAYDINAGGCCYVAYCFAKLLESDNIKYRLIIYEDYELEENFKDLSESHYHYAIAFGKIVINPAYDDFLVINKYQVSSSDILKHYKKQTWNTCYDSSKNSFINNTLKNFYYDFTEDLREE